MRGLVSFDRLRMGRERCGGREWIPAFAGTGFCGVGCGLRGLVSFDGLRVGALRTKYDGRKRAGLKPTPTGRR